MIVVDTSAFVAIALEEPGRKILARKLFGAPERVMSIASLVEATMVLSRIYSDPKSAVEEQLRRGGIVLCSVDTDHARWAQHAFLTYGKGHHPARLNLGDCFSYAAAKALNAPLLYVGGDFDKTDVKAA